MAQMLVNTDSTDTRDATGHEARFSVSKHCLFGVLQQPIY
ncbi:hypothetical protein 01orf_00103 [Orf virus]|uniref:Uncharacterized protein n=1 Tax=Orf virus TaxID=10258 RepID=A0A6M6A9P8_ORFV|nr:hypothetical protein 01orf_00103 [Orf virus]